MRTRAILRKEWQDLLKNRMIFWFLMFLPLFLSCFPLSLLLLTKGQPVNTTPEMLEYVGRFIPNVTPELAGGFLVVSNSLLFIMMIPVVLPVTISMYSIIGEKQTGSLEILLAEPVETREIILGKSIAAVLPGIIGSWLAYVLLVVESGIVASPEVFHYVISPLWIVIVAVVCPLLTVIGVITSIVVSSRVNDPRISQLITGM